MEFWFHCLMVYKIFHLTLSVLNLWFEIDLLVEWRVLRVFFVVFCMHHVFYDSISNLISICIHFRQLLTLSWPIPNACLSQHAYDWRCHSCDQWHLADVEGTGWVTEGSGFDFRHLLRLSSPAQTWVGFCGTSQPPMSWAIFPRLKRLRLLLGDALPSTVELRIYEALPPLPQYVLVGWCLTEHRENFSFKLYFMHPLVLENK